MYVHQVQLNRIPYYTQFLEIAMVIITKKSFLFFLTVYWQERKSYIVNFENIKKKGKKNIDDDDDEEDADSYFKLYEIKDEQVTYVRTYVQNNLYPQAFFFMEKHVDFNSPHMVKALEIVQATDADRLWKVVDGIKKLFRTTIETKRNYTVHRMKKFVTGKVLKIFFDADKHQSFNLTICFPV